MNAARLLKDSSLYTAGNIANRAVGFLMIPVYTFFLTPGDYGLIELTDLFLIVTATVIGIGAIGDAMVRTYYDHNDVDEQVAVVSTALLLTVAGSGAVAVAAWSLAEPLSLLLFQEAGYAWFIRVAFAAMVFANFIEVVLVYQRVRGRALLFVGYSLIQLSLTLGLNIYFIAFAGFGVWGFLISKLIATAAGSVFWLWRLRREIPWRWHATAARAMAKFGAPLIPAGLAFFTIHFSSQFFLNYAAGLADVGIYALAYKFGVLVTFLVGEPFARVWDVRLYAYTAEPRWREQFMRVFLYLAFSLISVGLAVALTVDEIVAVIAEPSFHPAAVLVPMIACAFVFREVGDFFRASIYIDKKSALVGKIALACAAINVALNYVLIGRYGVQGAAASLFLTWAAYLALCWTFAARAHRFSVPWRPLLVMASSASAVYVASASIPVDSWSGQALTDAALIGAFVVATFFACFPRRERHALATSLREIVRRTRTGGSVDGYAARAPVDSRE